MKDMGDKADAAEVADINKAKDELKKALEGNDTAEIKAKTEALQDVLYKLTEKCMQPHNRRNKLNRPRAAQKPSLLLTKTAYTTLNTKKYNPTAADRQQAM